MKADFYLKVKTELNAITNKNKKFFVILEILQKILLN